MRIRFVDEARVELLDGISYYEKQQPGFGRRFKVEVEQTLLCSLSILKRADLDRLATED
jgi:hypothetical protein